MAGGGGGGGTGKASTSGLMNWNQAWALWSSLQLSQAHQKEYLKGVQANQARQQQGNVQLPARLIMVAARLFQSMGMQGVAQRLNTLAQNVNQFTNSVQNGIKAMVRLSLRGLDRINITDKLATILGDGKKLLDDILRNNVDALKNLMTRFQFLERLAQVNHLMEKMFKTLATEATQWIHEIGERVEQVLEQLKRLFKKTRNPKQKHRFQK
jgi:hypothetical protein